MRGAGVATERESRHGLILPRVPRWPAPLAWSQRVGHGWRAVQPPEPDMKGVEKKKESKKKPQKSLKEKRAEKQAKKAERS
jgi:hypothetical protein